MARKYTAQEMRLVADNVCSDFTFARINVGSDARPVYRELKPYEVAAMLRQAADMMEREKKYEYGVSASYGVEQYDSLEHARQVFRGKARVVRREVGEWEEVK